MSRFEVYNQLKDQNLLSLRFQSRKKELSQNSSRSYLSKNSSKILKEKQYKPPFKKTEEVLSHKRQTIFALQEKVEKEQKIKNPEPSFKPNIINNHGKEGVRRTKEEFYHEMMEWMRHKIDGQTRKKLEIRKKEEIEITFHPLINYKSNSIANESNREKIIVEERLCKWKEKLDEKRKNMILMNKSSDFIHKISDNSEILAQQYREKMKHKQIEKKNGKEKDEEYSNINEDLLENNTRKNFSVSFNLENNTVEEINDEKFKNSEEGGMEKDENDSNNESVI